VGIREKYNNMLETHKKRERLFRCEDCGVNTSKIEEYYMVLDEVWLSVCEDVYGMLCIGCLEERLGRRLMTADFTDCPLNNWKLTSAPWPMKRMGRGSERLLSRLTGD